MAELIEETNDKLVLRKLIPAPRHDVFAAWSDPDSIRQWMCPGDVIESEAQIDFRVGGSFRIVMKSPKDDCEHTGTYQVIEPPSKLSFTWISINTDFKTTLVTVELFEREGGTELILTHERFPSADRVRQHKGGWSMIADRLAEHFQRGAATRTVAHEVTLNAAPEEVFEALMDSAKHSAFTGVPAEIERKVGGAFTCYGGQLKGTTLELKPNERIVQQWRSENWPAGHYSRLTFKISPVDGGRQTQLSMTHTGVPASAFDDINQGWRKYYWSKMAPYFRAEKVAVVRRFMEEFKNKENLDIVDELMTPDFVLHLPGKQLPPGPKSQKAVGKAIFDAFSQVHVTADDTIVEGDRVVERHTARAVHSGEFQGVPATGRNVSWTENHIYRIQNGRIAEAWSEVSFHDLMAQITSGGASRPSKEKGVAGGS
jgi:uncharacterized protein YndB with AHSA1/START domain/ketosteroid isomerase-like protein